MAVVTLVALVRVVKSLAPVALEAVPVRSFVSPVWVGFAAARWSSHGLTLSWFRQSLARLARGSGWSWVLAGLGGCLAHRLGAGSQQASPDRTSTWCGRCEGQASSGPTTTVSLGIASHVPNAVWAMRVR
jgi:hypothetical protein